MIITDYKLYNEQELFSIIRNTYLAGDRSINPFRDAKISIQTVSYRDLVPTQTFVLGDQLAKIRDIKNQMANKGIDIFKLKGFFSYRTDGADAVFSFTPPIVEVIDNQPLVIDGMHRITYAADNDIKFNSLIIENVPKDVWPYQLPIAGGWDAVQRFDDTLPDGFVRKQRRYPTSEMNKYFFREYPFPGILKIMRAHSGRPDGR